MKMRTQLQVLIGLVSVSAPWTALADAGPTCAKVDNATGWYAMGSTLAEEGFSSLAFMSLDRSVRDASKSGSDPIFPAIDCLNRIQAGNALMDLPNYDSLIPAFVTKAKGSKENQEILARFAFRSVLQRIGAKQSVTALLPALQGSSYATAATGLVAASTSDWKAAKAALAATLRDSKNDSLKSTFPAIRLAYARSLYALGEDVAAIAEYEKLFQIGLPMQDALIESAWAQLRSKNYMKSIGLSYELTTGKLAQFFAPEALSIRAISFLENCRYSESRKLVEQLSATYGPIAQWLKASSKSQASLYETAIARSEGAIANEAIPEKVWSLWTGSDFFVSTQKGIRQSFEESRTAPEWISKSDGTAQTKETLQADLKQLEAARTRAAARIETHLEDLNRSMGARITQESGRLKLVGIEANQGAGRDLVFRNANPGLADAEKKMIKEDRKAKSYTGKLSWGDVNAEDPSAELWVDEIGAFEAASLDRCKAKAAYKAKDPR